MQQALDMYKGEDTNSEYPHPDSIKSYEDLKSHLQKYWRFPPEPDLDFVSYELSNPTTFRLVVRARDLGRTEFIITKAVVLANGEPVKLPRRR
jgi:hypothetical protein